MTNIIKITKNEIGNAELNSVNARDIHNYLQVNSKFADWIKRAIVKYDFKENIDSKYATITSDYDFCFTVKKKIELFTPEKYELDVSPIKARKPRYETRYRKTREHEIFEMTYSPENYKGYTPIKEFEGKDLKDLKHNIEVFCKNLIEKINTPLKDCPHCKGYGVILDSEIKQSE